MLTRSTKTPRGNYRRVYTRDESKAPLAEFWRYNILLPQETPYLSSEESLLTHIRMWRDQRLIPEITLQAHHRFDDRDVLEIRIPRRENVFRPKATREEREVRNTFLEVIADIAIAARDLPKHVEEACEQFLQTYGFMRLVWNGGGFTFTNSKGVEREGYRLAGQSIQKAQGTLSECIKAAQLPPFLYKAAPV